MIKEGFPRLMLWKDENNTFLKIWIFNPYKYSYIDKLRLALPFTESIMRVITYIACIAAIIKKLKYGERISSGDHFATKFSHIHYFVSHTRIYNL